MRAHDRSLISAVNLAELGGLTAEVALIDPFRIVLEQHGCALVAELPGNIGRVHAAHQRGRRIGVACLRVSVIPGQRFR